MAPSQAWASRARRFATACRTSPPWRWTSSRATGAWSRPGLRASTPTLFQGFPNSYGTLGYALRARIELEPVHAYVHLRHLPFRELPALVEALAQVCATRSYAGEAVAFVDGTVFSPDESYLTLGSWCDDVPAISDYTRSEIYYRSIQSRRQDWLTVRDYLWRWDTDWFWCSRAFGAQRPWVRRLAGPRLLRSDVYRRLLAVEERFHPEAALDRLRHLPPARMSSRTWRSPSTG